MKLYVKEKSYRRSPGQIGRAFLLNRRSILGVLICMLANYSIGQNILPNSGFETPVHSIGNRWQQPTGQYEHYELNNDFAANGNYYSGICMYSSEPNEYFFVPLMEHLISGKTYHISMNVRIWEGKCIAYEELDSIGVLFDSVRHDVSTPFYSFNEPSLKLEMDIIDPHQWFEIQETYIANGSERYMMIGNFFDPPKRSMDPLLVDVDMGTELKNEKKGSKRKKERDNKAFRDAVNREMRAADPSLDTGAYFRVRFYFDDICLALIDESGQYSCRDNALPSSPKSGDVIVGKHINFETDRSTLLESSYLELNTWIDLLHTNPNIEIQVNGHTDDTGDRVHNLQLSEERANVVMAYLVSQGISAERVSYRGYGSSKPISDNGTKEGRAANRRVEFVILAD